MRSLCMFMSAHPPKGPALILHRHASVVPVLPVQQPLHARLYRPCGGRLFVGEDERPLGAYGLMDAPIEADVAEKAYHDAEVIAACRLHRPADIPVRLGPGLVHD